MANRYQLLQILIRFWIICKRDVFQLVRKYDKIGGVSMVKREYEITAQYNTSDVKEISVDWNGCSFLIIYGKHINGGFFSISNWGGELSRHFVSDMFDNAKHINEHLKNEEAAIQIAIAIAEVETFPMISLKKYWKKYII